MRNSYNFTNAVGALGRTLARVWLRARDRVARADVRLTKRISSPRAFISSLGIITTCMTIFAPPVAYAVLSAFQLQQRADEQATLGARHLEVQLDQGHAVDWLNRVSINVLHATRVPNSVV